MTVISDERRRVLRPRPWLVAVAALAATVFAIGAVAAYRSSGWGWRSAGFVGLALFGVAGLLETATARIRLSDTALECGPLWARRTYAADEIVSVTWEAGAGVSAKLASGGWARIPEMGYNAQGLTNTLRAWLKRAANARKESMP